MMLGLLAGFGGLEHRLSTADFRKAIARRSSASSMTSPGLHTMPGMFVSFAERDFHGLMRRKVMYRVRYVT